VDTPRELELRTIVPAERAAVLDLLAQWLGDRAFFARYFEHDPSFRDDLCFVAVDRGAIVSTLQVFRRVVRLAAGVVQVAAVGNVFTTEAYRERGLATALLERALAAMPTHGFDMSLLFATRIAFYGRLGWQSHVRHLIFLEPDRGTAGGPYTVERFRADDLDAVARIYDTGPSKTSSGSGACSTSSGSPRPPDWPATWSTTMTLCSVSCRRPTPCTGLPTDFDVAACGSGTCLALIRKQWPQMNTDEHGSGADPRIAGGRIANRPLRGVQRTGRRSR